MLLKLIVTALLGFGTYVFWRRWWKLLREKNDPNSIKKIEHAFMFACVCFLLTSIMLSSVLEEVLMPRG